MGVKEEEEEKGGRERERGREETMVVKIVSECETPKVKEGSCTCYVVVVHDLDRKNFFFLYPSRLVIHCFVCVSVSVLNENDQKVFPFPFNNNWLQQLLLTLTTTNYFYVLNFFLIFSCFLPFLH